MKKRFHIAIALLMTMSWISTLSSGAMAQDPGASTPEVSESAETAEIVMPVDPAIIQASCDAGVVTAPVVQTATTAGVDYSVTGTPEAGGQATVIAQLQAGFAWADELPGSWTHQGDGTVTYVVTFDAVDCSQGEVTAPVDHSAEDTSASTPESDGDFGAAALSCDPGHVGVPVNATITNMVMSPDPVPSTGTEMRFDFDWAVPDTAQEDDFFVIDLPNELGFISDSFPLTAVGDPTTTIANAVVISGTMTITLTDYACESLGINGNAFVFAKWDSSTYGTTVDVTFGWTGGGEITIPGVDVPASSGGPSTASPGKSSGWSDSSDQGVINLEDAFFWSLTSPVAPAGGFDTFTFSDTVPGTDWEFYCGYFEQYYYSSGDTANTSVETCTSTSITVTFVNVPEGEQVRVRVGVTILDTTGPWSNTAAWDYDASGLADSGTYSATRTRSSGGGGEGSGEVSPVAPIVVQAGCIGGVDADPSVTLPTNTDAIVYTLVGIPAAGQTVQVVATLQEEYTFVDSLPAGWVDQGDGTATYEIVLEEGDCTPVVPVDPDVVQAACVGGVLQPASVTPADGPTGITYSLSGTPVMGSSVVVTAQLANGYEWGATNPNWTYVDADTATFTAAINVVECDEITPVVPTITAASCVDGVAGDTTIVFASGPDGVTYTQTAGTLEPGTVVTITATLSGTSQWADTITPWVVVNATTATYTVTLPAADCDSALPVDPIVTQATCLEGTLTNPTIDLADTDGIVYSTVGVIAPGQTVTVVATLEDGYVWGPGNLPANWVDQGDGTAEFIVVLDDPECAQVSPIAPIVVQQACVDGGLTTPSVTLSPDTDSISYTLSGTVAPGNIVTVTATLEDDSEWISPLPAGWTLNQQAGTVSYDVTLAIEDCTVATPVAPEVTEASCVNGEVGAPVVEFIPVTGISYELVGTPVAGGMAQVIATLEDGYEWPSTMPEGWTETSSTTAEFDITFDDAECGVITPVAPDVTQASCINGGITQPVVRLADTVEGIFYSKSGDEVPGGTVTVTATLLDGSGWPEVLPEGWTMISPTTATYEVVLDDAECTAVVPVTPEVTQGSCVDGSLMLPVLTPAVTDGIEYTFNGSVVPGATVIVTATVLDGFQLSAELPEGWTMTSPTTATWSVVLDQVECEEVAPVNPVVTDVNCDIDTPSVALPENTNGVTYTKSGDEVPGGTVEITARLNDGYRWISELPEGWTLVDGTTATFPVTLGTLADDCDEPSETPQPGKTPVAPATPVKSLPNTGAGEDGALGGFAMVFLAMMSLAALAGAALMRRRTT